MTKRRVFLAALAGCWLVVAAGAARGDERILRYHSDITVAADGWLTVAETIRVRCERKRIKRGIYRDFPVRYKGRRDFREVLVPFEVVSVERDGQAEAFHTEGKGNNQRVYMGRKGVRLKAGEYTYKLTYRTRRQVGFFEKHDELYWNVTGNEWLFAIDAASATVSLPAGITAGQIGHEAYTGEAGAKGKAYRSSVDAAGRAQFRTTKPLAVGEGLTIVTTFPKGFVTPPTDEEELGWFLRDNAVVAAGLIGLAIVVAYYAGAWVRVGRDPAKGVIFPRFEAPEGLCPAGARYVLRMGYDQTCFVAAIVALGVKRCLRIDDEDGDYTLVRTRTPAECGLSRAEAKAAGRLFQHGTSIELDNSKSSRFKKAIAGVKDVLADEYRGRGKYFVSNTKWLVPGVGLSVATLAGVALTAALVEGRSEVAFLCVFLAGWSVGTFFLVRQVIRAWWGVLGARGVGDKAVSTGGALFLTLFAVPFVGAEIGVAGYLVYATSIYLLPALVVLGLANVWFYRLLKQPTVEGRKVMDAIEGLRMYLGTAEKDVVATATLAEQMPERTPEVFERFLPYAIALGVENAWAERFEDVLARAAAATDGYRPRWYHGTAWGALSASRFASSLGGSFSSALSSASTPPGSSSGSGGGGSSGGGGGGGGGGGW